MNYPKVRVIEENRSSGEPFGTVEVNDIHIWRVEFKAQAELVASNLVKAFLKQKREEG